MNYVDLITIYLSCGAPFGVYQITKGSWAKSPSDFAKVVYAFFLWPAFLVPLMVERLSTEKHPRPHFWLEDIRNKIENTAFQGHMTASLFEFREIYYRFTGLSEALSEAVPQKTANDLFAISGIKNPVISSKCISRRNRERLEFHQVRARNEFVDLISSLARGNPEGGRVVDLAIELSAHLGDADAEDDLKALRPAKQKPETMRLSHHKEKQGSAIISISSPVAK